MLIFQGSDARSKIMNAYLIEIKQKPYNKISVSSVIAKAGVNRSTFYRNFCDIYDLYDKLCDDVIGIISKSVMDNYVGDYTCSIQIGELSQHMINYETIVGVIREYKDVIIALSGKNGNISFIKKLRNVSKRFISERLFFENSAFRFDPFFLSFITDADMLSGYIMAADSIDGAFRLKSVVPFVRPNKPIIYNVASVACAVSGDKSIIEFKLIKAAFNLWSERRTISTTVSDITKRAGISRTEFYSCYKNMLDFYLRFEKAATDTLGLYILQLCFSDIIDFGTRFNFEKDKLNSKYLDLIGCIDHDRVFGFVFNTAVMYRNIFISIVEKDENKKFDDEMILKLTEYFSAVFCTAIRFILFGDDENMKRIIGLCYKYRDELRLYDKKIKLQNIENAPK